VFGVTAASRNTRFQAARYGLTWTGLAPADRASFAWRLPSLDHPDCWHTRPSNLVAEKRHRWTSWALILVEPSNAAK
jgi:hypothetical protein